MTVLILFVSDSDENKILVSVPHASPACPPPPPSEGAHSCAPLFLLFRFVSAVRCLLPTARLAPFSSACLAPLR